MNVKKITPRICYTDYSLRKKCCVELLTVIPEADHHELPCIKSHILMAISLIASQTEPYA